ncbi:MAG TPA: hypothetical protein PK637_05030 [Flavobacteriales bacterium]|nr:hypothetical protein [Flavobacteriales bacterium]HRE96106.1 hypothetical protein [Flavobacteriales bacterium]HRJ37370.1 hypothetical protein [Flavobacteriales bacterium]
MKRFLLLFLLFGSAPLFAGNDNLPVGARSAGMANASVGLQDVWSVHHNQAGLAFLDAPTASVYYENRYLLREMGLSAFAFALPVKQGTFGLLYHAFGSAAYNESKTSLAYGMKLSPVFSVGIGLNYTTIRFGDVYGRSSALCADLGFQVQVTKDLRIAAHAYNLNRAKHSGIVNNEYIPSIMRLGAHYTVSPKVIVATEVQKDIDHPVVFRAGAEYKVVEKLAIRAGVSTRPTLNNFGFGFYLKQFTLDVAASYHQTLGFSPQVGMTYRFGKEKSETPAP